MVRLIIRSSLHGESSCLISTTTERLMSETGKLKRFKEQDKTYRKRDNKLQMGQIIKLLK